MVNLQIQDIRQHVLECNRKAEITKQKIADNLKLQ